MKMKESLCALSIRVWARQEQDLVLIYAEPGLEDLKLLLSCQDPSLLDLVCSLIWELSDGGLEATEDDVIDDREDLKVEAEACSEDPIEFGDGIKVETDDLVRDEKIMLEIIHNKSNARVPIKKVKRNTFACQICNKVFKSSSNAHKHVKIHGVATEPVEDRTCPHCGTVFAYAALCRVHLKRTCLPQRSPRCDACDINFPTRLELKEHIRNAHAQDARRCAHCNFVATTVASKFAHEKAMHLNLKCRQCRKFFPSVDSMADHKCTPPERLQCGDCDKAYGSRKELKDHVSFVHKGLKHTCSECNTSLATEKNLKRHIRTVHQVQLRRFPCPVVHCGKMLKDARTLANHVKTHDTNFRSDPCPECGKVLASNDSLRQHIKVIHEKNLKQVCEDCGKVFPSLSTLRTHGEMVHMRGRLEICHLCGKEVLGENRLRNHMQRSHPKGGQQFASCQHCHKEIPMKQLRSHIVEAHKMQDYKYQCDLCPKRFDVKSAIRKHYRKHTKARPYLCRGCGAYFRDLMSGKEHVRAMHTADLEQERASHAADSPLIHYDPSRDTGNPYAG